MLDGVKMGSGVMGKLGRAWVGAWFWCMVLVHGFGAWVWCMGGGGGVVQF